MFCGSSLKNKGVQLVLDAVSTICLRRWTSPRFTAIDTNTDAEVTRHPDPKEPFAALVFKVITTRTAWASWPSSACIQGTVSTGRYPLNTTKGKPERMARIYQMHANKREAITGCERGQHRCGAGLKDCDYRRHDL